VVLAALVLTAAAWLRSAEYDEQYTLFLTAGTPRPDWPASVFPAGAVAVVQAGHATMGGIARDLRATDVHPPLYFWAVSLWRWVFGPGLFAARMLSALCGVVSIALVGIVAGRCGIRPAVAMLLTLGCYGFVYTNAIARGFAVTEMLTLSGVVMLLGGRRVLAGVCLGAAWCCNYLAVFVGVAVLFIAGAWVAIPVAIPFLGLDAWFYVAQHAARPGQFPPFAVWPSVVRLAEYQVAAVFGGLPLYVDGGWRVALEAGLGVAAVSLVVCIARVRPWRVNRLVLAAAVASPLGLFLLGAVFDNMPIELRYLSFGLPFVALLAAASLPLGASSERSWPDWRSRVQAYRCFPVVAGRVPVIHRPAGCAQMAGTRPVRIRIGHWRRLICAVGRILSGCVPAVCASTVRARMAGTRPAMTVATRLARQIILRSCPVLKCMKTRPATTVKGEPSVSGQAENARAAGSRSPSPGRKGFFALVLILQFGSIAGLLLSPRTMQSARIAATEAVRLAGDAIVLVPAGNDGVGIVGAFGIEAPPTLPMLLIRPGDPIADRVASYQRVAVALLAEDRDSTAAIGAARGVFTQPNWRRVAIGTKLEVYERGE
jgi:hypothetical protein